MVKFNDRYFDELMNSAGVKAMTRRAAEKTLEYAKAHAPVDTGAYRDGLQIQEVKHEHRTTCMVVGSENPASGIEDWQSPQGVEGR